MSINKLVVIAVLSFTLCRNVPTVLAAPPVEDLNQYLTKIGWSKQDLMDYLAYYEIPLNEINSIAALEELLGTPINSENYNKLLSKFNLSDKQLKDLLHHYGDSLNKYKFIEDLDMSVGFYFKHDAFFAEIENDLNELGISEQEVGNLFEYLAQVEENNKNQLDQLKLLDARMEEYLNKTDPTELTKDQINDLAEIFTEAADLLKIRVTFNMNNQNISFQDLLKMEDLPGNLYTRLYSSTGQLLVDFNLTSDFFQSVINGWDEMLHVGDLSNEFVDLMHEGKYNALMK